MQLLVAVLLVLVEHRVHRGDCLAVSHSLAVISWPRKQLVQRLGVDLERRVLADVPLDDAEDFRRDVLGLVPVLLVPLLEDGDRPPVIWTFSSMFSVRPG